MRSVALDSLPYEVGLLSHARSLMVAQARVLPAGLHVLSPKVPTETFLHDVVTFEALERLELTRCVLPFVLTASFWRGVEFPSLTDFVLSHCYSLFIIDRNSLPSSTCTLHVLDCENLAFVHSSVRVADAGHLFKRFEDKENVKGVPTFPAQGELSKTRYSVDLRGFSPPITSIAQSGLIILNSSTSPITSSSSLPSVHSLLDTCTNIAALPKVIQYFSRIKELSLSGLQLEDVPSLDGLNDLETLDVSCNCLTDAFLRELPKWRSLRNLDLSHNRFSKLPAEVFLKACKKDVDIRKLLDLLSALLAREFLTFSEVPEDLLNYYGPEQLGCPATVDSRSAGVRIRSAPLLAKLHDFLSLATLPLWTLRVRGNGLTEVLPETRLIFPHLRVLDVSMNRLSSVALGMPKLPDESVVQASDWYPLRWLDASHNLIQRIDPPDLALIPNVDTLILDDNALEAFPMHHAPPSLESLHLRGNVLKSFSLRQRRRPFPMVVDLSWNCLRSVALFREASVLLLDGNPLDKSFRSALDSAASAGPNALVSARVLSDPRGSLVAGPWAAAFPAMALLFSEGRFPTDRIRQRYLFDAMRAAIAYGQPREKVETLRASVARLSSFNPETVLDQLNQYVGLPTVKAHFFQLKEELVGRASSESSSRVKVGNFLFTGPPGTGKTSIARTLTDLLFGLGLLRHRRLVEVKRADLVAEYTGQSAPKTRAAVQRAVGGVLFVDEAYALVQGPSDSFGKESIEELMTSMENLRDDLVVVLAGYEREMDELLSVNPGLDSRINRRVRFEQFSPDVLLEVLRANLARDGVPPLAVPEQTDCILELFKMCYRDPTFGNARGARNMSQSLASEYHRARGSLAGDILFSDVFDEWYRMRLAEYRKKYVSDSEREEMVALLGSYGLAHLVDTVLRHRVTRSELALLSTADYSAIGITDPLDRHRLSHIVHHVFIQLPNRSFRRVQLLGKKTLADILRQCNLPSSCAYSVNHEKLELDTFICAPLAQTGIRIQLYDSDPDSE